MTCAICHRLFSRRSLFTVRQAWLDAGGFGLVPDSAIVHPAGGRRKPTPAEHAARNAAQREGMP